jgi:hypothetical protein
VLANVLDDTNKDNIATYDRDLGYYGSYQVIKFLEGSDAIAVKK